MKAVKNKRNGEIVLPEDKCLEKKDGFMCTLPKGHTGDHVAESGRVGNIVGTWQEGTSDAGPGQSSPGH